MRDSRQVLWGIVTALVSIALLLGVLSLSLVEGNMRSPAATLPPTITITKTPTPSTISQVDSPTPLTITLTHTWTSTWTPTWTPTWTSTLLPTPSNCPPPFGWSPYAVQPGDTLDGLALKYKRTSLEISQANCLGSAGLFSGLVIYLPPLPTRTPVPCSAPATWIIYIVQPGDTLYHLGQVYGIPYTDIQHANCLNTTNLRTGQRLYVPPWATRTPSPTFPGFPTSSFPSETPTETPTPTVTTESSTPTDTETPTATPITETPTS